MKFALCHRDRKHYAKDLCNSCYSQLVRDLKNKLESDRNYEERNREQRNEQRRVLAVQRRADRIKLKDV